MTIGLNHPGFDAQWLLRDWLVGVVLVLSVVVGFGFGGWASAEAVHESSGAVPVCTILIEAPHPGIDIAIHRHRLNLSAAPAHLLNQVARLADHIKQAATPSLPTPPH